MEGFDQSKALKVLRGERKLLLPWILQQNRREEIYGCVVSGTCLGLCKNSNSHFEMMLKNVLVCIALPVFHKLLFFFLKREFGSILL